ncbi:hypothetical protein PsorP6_006937 [Peronosclerospora sorghi]|uniref:Uncharacterized protein n=1 Tax=Peronosclerospora sorghi TaxID=230839 RepID=A0ACC0W8M7_9STRA|nr:hypothetical protein PsorP6_006937 [Peronosclerospora sorghi]
MRKQWLLWVHVLSLPCIHGVLPTGILSFEATASAVTRQYFFSPSSVARWGVALPTRPDAPWNPLTKLPAANQHGSSEAQEARAHGLIVSGTKEDVYDDIRRKHVPASKPAFEYDCSRCEAFVASLACPVWDTDAPACHQDPQC